MATALRLALGILQGRGGISLLDNEDEPIFRGHFLPDQSELLVIFYKLFQLRRTHWIRNPSFLLGPFMARWKDFKIKRYKDFEECPGHKWEVYARKVL